MTRGDLDARRPRSMKPHQPAAVQGSFTVPPWTACPGFNTSRGGPVRRGTTINTRVRPAPKEPFGPCRPALRVHVFDFFTSFHPLRMRSSAASRQTMDMLSDARGPAHAGEELPMSRPHAVLVGSIALGAAVALLTGCSPSNPPAVTSSPTASVSSPPASVSPVCAAADAHAAALARFQGNADARRHDRAGPGGPRPSQKTYEDLAMASANLAQQRADAVKAAEAKFNAAVAAVPDTATLTQAADSLRDEASNVEAAVRDLRAEVTC